MFKKIIKGIAVGSIAVLMAGGAASAVEVNLFGASAQYKFWTSAAPQFLADPDGANCTGGDGVHYYTLDADAYDWETAGLSERDAGVAIGTGCGDNHDTDITISYTTYASIEGIKAVKGNVNDPDTCGDQSQRAVPDTTTVSGGTAYVWGSTEGSAGDVNDLTCKDIHIGASDVAGETFGQETHGDLLGPLGGDDVDKYADPVDTTGLENKRPIVVPFAFFGDADLPTDNISRLMATSLFSGAVANWSDFGYAYDQMVTLCMRHAGSGTHATLDADVLRGDVPLVTEQVTSAEAAASTLFGIPTPAVYFNKGSSDLMRCISNIGDGAIGYADADKNGAAADGTDGNSAIKRLTYMGEDGTADAIKKGRYDFWSAQWLYYRTAEDADVIDIIEDLSDYASIGDNIPSSKSGFWAAQDDMEVQKTDDFTWPKRKE